MEETVKFNAWESKGSKKVNAAPNTITIFNANVDGNGTSENVQFTVTKLSYAKRLEEIADHMNYFLEVYDKENELIEQLTKVRNDIHNPEGIVTAIFIGYLYRTVFTPSIKKKILSMVDDNFVFEDAAERSLNYVAIMTPPKKALMIVATAMKLIIPAVFEFIEVKGVKAREILLTIYSPLFEMFEDTKRLPDALHSLLSSKVKVNHMRNVKVYEALELDPDEVEEDLYRILVTDALFKCVFDKDALNFLYVIIDNQLSYLLHMPIKST